MTLYLKFSNIALSCVSFWGCRCSFPLVYSAADARAASQGAEPWGSRRSSAPLCRPEPLHTASPRPTGSADPTSRPATAQAGCWPRGSCPAVFQPRQGCVRTAPSDDTQPGQLRWPRWVGSTASPRGAPVSSGLTPSRGGRLHWRERRGLLVGFGKTISENFSFMWEIGINLILCCILYLSCV